MIQLSKEKEELESLYNKILVLGMENDMKRLLELCDCIIILATKLSDHFKLGLAFKLKGFAYYRLNEIEKAIECYRRAEIIFEECVLVKELTSTKLSLGVLYRNKAELKLALGVLNEALELSIENDLLNSNIFNSIALIYIEQKDYRNSLYYFLRAIEVEKSSQEPNLKQIKRYEINCANIAVLLRDYSKAEKVYRKAIKFFLEFKDYEFVIASMVGLANVMLIKEELGKAENILIKVKQLCSTHEFYGKLVDVNLSLAKICKQLQRPKDQLAYLEEALTIAEKSYLGKIEEVLVLMLEFHRSSNNIKEAHLVLKRLANLRIDRYKKERDDNFLEFQKQFESDYQERLLQQKRRQNEELQNQQVKLLAAVNFQRHHQLRLQSLQVQLNPHFLFNAMQIIQVAILNEEAIMASDYLAQFANLMRGILKSSRIDHHSLADELSLLKNYVHFEQERGENKFRLEFVLKNIEFAEKLLLPSLLLQPFVARAIYACRAAKNQAEVLLNFRKSKHFLYAHIRDSAPYLKRDEKNNETSVFFSIEDIILQQLKDAKKCKTDLVYSFKKLKRSAGRSAQNHVVFAFPLNLDAE